MVLTIILGQQAQILTSLGRLVRIVTLSVIPLATEHMHRLFLLPEAFSLLLFLGN